ncbi:hypothetical protein RLJV_23915 [Pseudomonas aeruginosa]|nr:hypothetical protein RLJV_23915 [Pseudomonas aeruginosa]
MNRMIGFSELCTSSITWRRRCSNSPFMLAPACSRPTSRARSSTSLLVTPDDGVELAATGLLGEVHGKALERLLLAHRARRQGAAGLARGGAS